MKKIFVLLLVLLLFGRVGTAQQEERNNYFAIDVGVGSYRGSLGVSFLHDWRFGSRKKFGVGLGSRFTSFLGANLYYITAPAQLTSGSTSPLIFFKENITENIDSLLIKSPQVNALNLMIQLDYQFNSRWMAGFNIDVIGFSFGGNRQANFMSGTSGKNTSAKPTPYNILLISDNDQGTLNSELFVNYSLNHRWAFKTGAQFLFTEYTTVTKVQQYPEENDRFRNKSLMFSLGASYKI